MQSVFELIPGLELPIFQRKLDGQTWFYSPGYLAVVDSGKAESFAAEIAQRNPTSSEAAGKLREHATEALLLRAEARTRLFTPVCLTIYPNQQCALHCIYCFSSPGQPTRAKIACSPEAVRSAARLVAQNCYEAGLPLTVAFHGGGEPALDLENMKRLLREVENAAAEHELEVFRYIATGGAIPEENAHWLAEHFDLVGLSCDGPAEIQDRQRPLRGGGKSSPAVQRTADLVHRAGKPLHVRVTVTSASVPSLPAIAEAICRDLQPQEIHVEEVYRGGRARPGMQISMEQVDEYVRQFFRARTVAQEHGIPWLSSGSRPAQIHGPYCNVFRNVLNLVPGDGATACFKFADTASARDTGMLIGAYHRQTDGFILDQGQIRQQQEALSYIDPECSTCFNQFHCARQCPDECMKSMGHVGTSVRCRVQKQLAEGLMEWSLDSWKGKPWVDGVISGEVGV